MKQFDDDAATGGPTVAAPLGDEALLASRAAAGDQQAVDLLYDRYFARVSWYFTIFGRRAAKVAVEGVMTQLFDSLGEPSELSLGERAYRLARATELRRPGRARTAAATKRAAGT